MAKLKVALCITDLDVGGAERALVELATRLDCRRFEPVVYCLGPRPDPDEASCVPPLEAAGVTVHCLGARRSWQLVAVVRRLAGLFQAFQPDLVQGFLFHANMVSRLAAWKTGIGPVVSGIRVAEPRKWHLWADRLTGSLVDRYVCVSHAVAHFSQARAGLPPEKLVVIPNAVDLGRFPAKSAVELAGLGIQRDRRLVTYVGRLERQKGVRWLIQSARRWLDRLPDCDLLIVGEGPQRKQLANLCRGQAIGGRVHFAGWRVDVPEILAASQLVVLPSQWEGMPNVVLEAMASRLPVVASDAEGVRELLGPAADEQTVPYGDSAQLAERIVRLVCDAESADDLGRRNRQRAEAEFTFDRVVRAYGEFWESLAAG